jgi:ribosome recycling factor
MTKLARSEGESGKVAVRNIRRDAIGKGKTLQKNKEISEDEEKGLEETIQKLTDRFVAEIDNIVEAKEAEIMEI